MLKEKLSQIRDFILKHYKLVFPALLILCVAVTVVIALHANSRSDEPLPLSGPRRFQGIISGNDKSNFKANTA